MTIGETEDIICEEMQKAWEDIGTRLGLVEGKLVIEDEGVIVLSRTIETFFQPGFKGIPSEVALKIQFEQLEGTKCITE